MKFQCKFYRTKGLITPISYCSLIDETIAESEKNVCFSKYEEACEFYHLYITKRRESLILEKVEEELGNY